MSRRASVPAWLRERSAPSTATRWSAAIRAVDAFDAPWRDVGRESSPADLFTMLQLADLPSGTLIRVRAARHYDGLLVVTPDGSFWPAPTASRDGTSGDPSPFRRGQYLPIDSSAQMFWQATPHRDYVDFWERANNPRWLVDAMPRSPPFVARLLADLLAAHEPAKRLSADLLCARWADHAADDDAAVPEEIQRVLASLLGTEIRVGLAYFTGGVVDTVAVDLTGCVANTVAVVIAVQDPAAPAAEQRRRACALLRERRTLSAIFSAFSGADVR